MATSAWLEARGHEEIKNVKADRLKLRKACKEIAKAAGDKLGAMNKMQYRWHICKAVTSGLFWQDVARKRENRANRLNSLNPVKAARIQALRDAWAKTAPDAVSQ